MNNRQTEILYTIALTQIPSVGNITALKLIDHCGSAEQIFKEPSKHLSKIEHISSAAIENIASSKEMALDTACKEMEYIEKKNITVFLKGEETYPLLLTQCVDAPVILFGKGNLNLNPKHTIAIVGTRRTTEYGIRVTKKIVQELIDCEGLQVISGLAIGIDTIAHQSALQNSFSTVGILGHGLPMLYPAGNRKLAEKMQENGGLLTEFISTVTGEACNFPRRNRIIAGMAEAVLIVEAYEKGGALITANLGASYNRDIFAIPGRIGDKASEGCNNLVKSNKAAMVTSGKDIIRLMMWENKLSKNTGKGIQKKLLLDLNEEERLIVDALQNGTELDIDALSIATNLTIATLSMTLLMLEFKGIIDCLPG
ncbi:MAG: DNA-processing protein DprA, partial [Bacteroidales bacterium]|nr:DNA-processing protein DprA [Bacteroidales bacterium]